MEATFLTSRTSRSLIYITDIVLARLTLLEDILAIGMKISVSVPVDILYDVKV